MKNYLAIGLTMLSACTFVSCNDDPDPTYSIESPTINSEDYTMGGTLRLLYSTDGTTFTESAPAKLAKNSVVTVKVNNGTEDLTSDDFQFDWSGSSASATDATADFAEFTVGDENPRFEVVVKDKQTLLASHRATGKFYALNSTNGDSTYLFKITFNGATLVDSRALVYHYGQKKLYLTLSNSSGGALFSYDAKTKTANKINSNVAGESSIWRTLSSLVVAEDDSLVGVGQFNSGNGFIKLGTNGAHSAKISYYDELCCGMGMYFNKEAGLYVVANGWGADYREVLFEGFSPNGDFQTRTVVSTFEGFPESVDFDNEWFTVKSIAVARDGMIYAIFTSSDSGATYLTTIDMTTRKIKLIKSIGEGWNDQFNNIAVVPNYALN